MPFFENLPSGELLINTVTQTVVSVGASTSILAANTDRKFFRVKNQDGGAAKVYIRFDSSAATTSNALELLVGQIYEEGVGHGHVVYTGEIRAIAAAGTVSVYVEERV